MKKIFFSLAEASELLDLWKDGTISKAKLVRELNELAGTQPGHFRVGQKVLAIGEPSFGDSEFSGLIGVVKLDWDDGDYSVWFRDHNGARAVRVYNRENLRAVVIPPAKPKKKLKKSKAKS